MSKPCLNRRRRNRLLLLLRHTQLSSVPKNVANTSHSLPLLLEKLRDGTIKFWRGKQRGLTPGQLADLLQTLERCSLGA